MKNILNENKAVISLDKRVKMLSKHGDPYDILEQELGPDIKDYRRKWEESGQRKLDLDYPLHLNIELVYGCNLRCQFCIFSQNKAQMRYQAKPNDKITYEKYCQIIDQGVEKGLASVALMVTMSR